MGGWSHQSGLLFKMRCSRVFISAFIQSGFRSLLIAHLDNNNCTILHVENPGNPRDGRVFYRRTSDALRLDLFIALLLHSFVLTLTQTEGGPQVLRDPKLIGGGWK